LSIAAPNIRLLACKQSQVGEGLIVRLQEASGTPTKTGVRLGRPPSAFNLDFRPFEIKTIRIERSGAWHETSFIDEA
jgi:hypothetical protein